MKKMLFISIFITLPFILKAQLIGNGTFASPYNGTFEGNLQWNSANFPDRHVFINGDVIIDNEQLSIEAGMKIIFLVEGADLIINGTGRLYAVGNSSDSILFTADDNNNGIYGQTGERWGHIIFNNPSGTIQSRLEYCTIKWGDVSTAGLPPASYGGGIYTNAYSNLIINKCTITNNKSTHGGGIMAYNGGASPTITNCSISKNTAVTSGGGIYLPSGSSSVISNCLVYNNSTGAGGGGGIFLDVCGNVRIINSDFVKNTTSTSTRGFNIQYYNISNITNRPRFINCIAWGSDNSITHVNGLPQSSDFNYCAIQDVSTPAASYLNCINLNAVNDAANGPNFVNPNLPAPDWSINLISPCRDAGTPSYPGVTIPPLDFAGNSRAGAVDIGAYEVNYNRWKTNASSTDWATAANWELGVPPTSSQDVIIPTGATNYPTGSASQDFTIGTGKLMLLNPGAQVTLGVLANGGMLRLESDSLRISSLICSSYSGNNAEVQLYLKGGAGTYGPNWHYISSPFNSLSTSVFSSVTLDLAQWVESLASANLLIGWVAFDGYVYRVDPVSGPNTGTPFSNLVPGKGYNHFYALNHLYALQGQLNTATVVSNLSYTLTSPDQPTRYGLNLLGNPFSSGLDWDQIANDPGYPANTSKAIYFNKSGTYVYYVNGVGSEAGVTGIIPPMQGFFTKTYTQGNSITLPASARVNGSIPARYKGLSIIPLIRLNLTSGNYSDNTVVRFDNAAKSGQDLDFDAPKLFINNTYPYIYSVSEGTKFAINGLPFPETLTEIPIVVNITSEGNHTLSVTEFQGLDNYQVTLADKTTGFEANLKTTHYFPFTASPGLLADRFTLKIGNGPTGIEDPVCSTGIFNIYPSSGYINIQTIADEWDGKSGSIRVLDLTGKVVSKSDNNYFSKNSMISFPARLPSSIYMVEIRTGTKRFVGKVMVK